MLKSPQKPLPDHTAIDLFSGAGGASYGFLSAGFKLLAYAEIMDNAALTYEKNIKCKTRVSDITESDPRELREKTLKIEKGELAVLIGCPPCQGFSSMRKTSAQKTDKRNELLTYYLDYVDEFRPAYLFFENVPGLINSEHGKVWWQTLTDGLNSLDYPQDNMESYKVNAADYGVPQKRNRIIFYAARKGIIPPPKPISTHCDPETTEGKTLISEGICRPWKTLRETIQKFDMAGKKFHNHHALEVSEKVKEFISHVPKDGGSRTSVPKEMWLKCHSEGYNGHKDVYGRAYWDRPTNTLTTGCTSISKGRYVHPEKDRAFTFREAASIQGFPDNFIFVEKGKKTPVPKAEISIQIGNAVPPPLAWSFAKVFSKEIQRLGIPKY